METWCNKNHTDKVICADAVVYKHIKWRRLHYIAYIPFKMVAFLPKLAIMWLNFWLISSRKLLKYSEENVEIKISVTGWFG